MNKTLKSVLDSIKKYRWSSIFLKYWKRLMVFIMIPFMAINVLIFSYYTNVNNIKTTSTITHDFSQITNSINKVFEEIDKNYMLFSTNNDVFSYIESTKSNPYPNSYKIIELMNNTVNVSNHMDSIHIYTFANDYVLSSRNSNQIENFFDRAWYEEYLKTGNTNFIVFSKSSFPRIVPDTIGVCYGLYTNNELSSMIIFNIDVNRLSNSIFGKQNSLYDSLAITNHSGSVIYSLNQQSENLEADSIFDYENTDKTNTVEVKNKKNIFYLRTRLENSNYFLTSSVDLTRFNKGMVNLWIIILFCIILILVIPFVISFYLSTQFYKSITEIITLFQDETTTTFTPGKQFNELLFISNNILNIINKKNNVELALAEKITNLKKAQSMALQMQVNPHFLFNTLNLVNVLVMKDTKRDSDAATVISLLSDLLHEALDTVRYMVSINDEIIYANKYIEIESIKYKHNFDVTWDVDEKVLNFKTIKLILQPIIENAFEHGIRPLKEDRRGMLSISVKPSKKDIVISVSDNGYGISTEKLKQLKDQLVSGELPEAKHIGLCNVNARLKLIYGDNYGCSISSDKNGTTVKIIIPEQK